MRGRHVRICASLFICKTRLNARLNPLDPSRGTLRAPLQSILEGSDDREIVYVCVHLIGVHVVLCIDPSLF